MTEVAVAVTVQVAYADVASSRNRCRRSKDGMYVIAGAEDEWNDYSTNSTDEMVCSSLGRCSKGVHRLGRDAQKDRYTIEWSSYRGSVSEGKE